MTTGEVLYDRSTLSEGTALEHFLSMEGSSSENNIIFYTRSPLFGETQKIEHLDGKIQKINTLTGELKKIEIIKGVLEKTLTIEGEIQNRLNIKGEIECQK